MSDVAEQPPVAEVDDVSPDNTPTTTEEEVVAPVATPPEDEQVSADGSGQEQAQAVEGGKGDNFVYDLLDESTSDIRKAYTEGQIHTAFAPIHASSGFPHTAYNNLHYIEPAVIISARGNSVVLYDTVTKKSTILSGLGTGSIGAIAVHPSGKYFAVGEKGVRPNILVYEYPSLNVVRVLRKGTERAYSDIVFNKEGDKLASVGAAPDFLLTVWNWRQEQIELHAKAFAQEVFRVQFSPVTEGRLITSGTGHIRFWKMADTFTGLKLQGDIGKFGNVDLTDISAFVELSNGKVVSGAESGFLHLWDGNFIQFEIANKEGNAPHEGMVVYVDVNGQELVTAGADGFLRVWDATGIEYAEVEEGDRFSLSLVREVCVGEGVQIRSVVRGSDHWLVHDEKVGAVYKVDQFSYEVSHISSFHSGAVTGSVSIPDSSTVVSCGQDGSVRSWESSEGTCTYTRIFSSAATGIALLENPAFVFVTFADGTVRILERCSDGFRLHGVLKPHTKAVQSIGMSADKKLIATTSAEDVFFFGVKGTTVQPSLTPLGIISAPAVPSEINFSKDGAAAWITTSEGIFHVPLQGLLPEEDFERETYKLNVSMKQVSVYVMQEKQVEEKTEGEETEETESGDIDNAEAAKDALNGATPTIQEESEDGDGDGSASLERVEPKLACILQKNDESGFYVTFKDQHLSDKVFETRTIVGTEDELEATVAFTLSDSFTGYATFLKYDFSNDHILIGSSAGSVQVRPLAWNGSFLQVDAHDCVSGRVSGVSMSSSQAVLCTTAHDGNVIFHSINLALGKDFSGPNVSARDVDEVAGQTQSFIEVADPSLSPALNVSADEPTDIIDSKVYSIEEARQKQEYDDQVAAAQQKKMQVRSQIEQLRQEFSALLKKNSEAEPSKRLPREAFELDPKLRQQLEAEAEKQVEAVRKEMAYDTEKTELQLKKLRARFLDNVLVERINMKAFRTPFHVTSFRVVELPKWLQKAIQEVHHSIDSETKQALQNERKSDSKARMSAVAEGALTVADEQGGGRNAASLHHTAEGGHMSVMVSVKGQDGRSGSGELVSRDKRPSTESEIRRRQREERMERRRQLEATKPDDNVKDLSQAPEIQHAVNNMGDYKLKSDPKYVVPETKRVNVEKKRRQMVLLQESVHFIKMGFNERFLALRDLKKRICSNVAADNDRIREINAEIGESDELFEPQVDDSEWPEKRFEYTDADLETFKVEREKRAQAAKRGKGMFGAGGSEEEHSNQEAGVKKAQSGSSQSTSQGEKKEGAQTATSSSSSSSNPGGANVATNGVSAEELEELSPLEKAERRRRTKKLQHEKKSLTTKINQAITSFDEAVYEMRREKYRLDADLKATDLKLLVLYQELELLKQFEPAEKALFEKFAKCQQQKSAYVAAMSECETDLAQRLEEIKSWQEKDKALVAEFNTAVGGQKSDFFTQLLKIFKKKVRRSRNKPDSMDADEDSDNDDYSDSNYSDGEDSQDEEDEDVCPIGCESSVYERVLELREKRLEQEEVLTEFNASVAELNKRYQQLQVKEKSIDKELSATEKQIQDLQSDKQKELNQINVAFPLKLSQIQYLEEGALPASIENGLIFTSTGMQRLRDRIEELQEEKVTLKHEFKELKKQHKSLQKSLRAKQTDIDAEKKKCEDVQILKFGQVIDLNVLEKVGADTEAEELSVKLTELEALSLRKVQMWERKIRAMKEQLADVTQQNTIWLERVALLTHAQYDLEDELNSTTRGMHVAGTDNSEQISKQEKYRLLDLVQKQEDELDALKSEIHVLRRKGGQVYAP